MNVRKAKVERIVHVNRNFPMFSAVFETDVRLNAREFATSPLDCFPSSWIISRLPLAPRAVIYCKREDGRAGLNDFPDMAADGRMKRHRNAFHHHVNDSLRKCKLAEIISCSVFSSPETCDHR